MGNGCDVSEERRNITPIIHSDIYNRYSHLQVHMCEEGGTPDR